MIKVVQEWKLSNAEIYGIYDGIKVLVFIFFFLLEMTGSWLQCSTEESFPECGDALWNASTRRI